MNRNIFRFVGIILVILFLALYLGQATGYYKYESNKKSVLTKKAIKRYEKDIKEGKTVNIKNYLQEEKNYSNIASRIGLGVSNLLEVSFNKIIVYIFSSVEHEVNYKK
ncbi:MAG: hypothetical protein IKG58_01925 [Bacilli bacterium]|nr:hypothetical protein [Bacilli bacterium]MBR3049305.1 hypothetical protein [Bacilli bacterium]